MGQRSRRRERAGDTGPPSETGSGDRLREGYARGEARNETIRRGLEPLGEGQRPKAVTVAVIVALVMCAGNVAAALSGIDVGSNEDDAIGFTILSTVILLIAAGGMWANRYWAVLGFQAILGLQITTIALALMLGAIEGWKILPAVALVVALGWLFWKLIRAMARMQMPERPRRPPR